jgi:aryl-alcohol dehydrogenase (NADP+)
MEYRRLGDSGLKVSRLCLGAMVFGGPTKGDVAERICASAFDAGINFIDTADAYGKGESERVVGKLIAPQRSRWVLATKVSSKLYPNDPNGGGRGRKWILSEVDASLARLNTDYIDLYYLHHDDINTSMEETVGTMGDLIRAGKIRYFGMSNHLGWRIAETVHVARHLGVPKPVALQPLYNAMNRQAETEMFPACKYYGLGIVTYAPLARGVLTGKYLPGVTPPAESRAGRKDQRTLKDEYRDESLAHAQTLKAHAEKRGMTAGQFALNWVLANELVTSVLVGPRTEEQWQQYLGALGHKLDAEDEALVNGLVAPGHPSKPGFNDPKYPLVGRVLRG